MTTTAKRGLVIGAAILVLAGGAFVLLNNRALSDIPVLGELSPATCPLSGIEPANDKLVDRPAVAVKVENNPSAYPLSGLEEAEIIYEEPVEGGLT
ncbi:MAG: DUF3048 domain-containing protein, partial [Actinomycetota bacterium]|nr:DUF3048 domain-containing protein [Actinomycetota bacterium]